MNTPNSRSAIRHSISTIKIAQIEAQFYLRLGLMDIKYRWKNGAPPSRDEAAHSQSLLDESQFDSDKDRSLAEETARKKLNVPVQIPDDERPVLPQ